MYNLKPILFKAFSVLVIFDREKYHKMNSKEFYWKNHWRADLVLTMYMAICTTEEPIPLICIFMVM